MQLANSHLIAAAPEMLEEMEYLIELAEGAMKNANKAGCEYIIYNALADAKEVVAKAIGGL